VGMLTWARTWETVCRERSGSILHVHIRATSFLARPQNTRGVKQRASLRLIPGCPSEIETSPDTGVSPDPGRFTSVK
jgi:hypothetical protein